MKFIHAADLHLDSPLLGLTRYEGVPLECIQNPTRRALANMVDLACDESVDFIVLAGDLYDGDWKDYNTGLFFNQQMSRLREAEIDVFMVRGNHDAMNSMTRQLRLPDNVVEFSEKTPETRVLEHLGVALHGQSFPTTAVTDDLSANYPKAMTGFFNIGVLHTSVNGREGHASYAPCSVNSLLQHDYDYWALGHVHNREILHRDPWVVFSGNLQGRHARETGAKGCTIVNVEDGAIHLDHREVDVMRWETCQIDISQYEFLDEVIDQTADAVTNALCQVEDKPLALRFELQGAGILHHELHAKLEGWSNQVRAAATDLSSGQVWVEKIKLHTRTLQQEHEHHDSALATLTQLLQELPNDEHALHQLAQHLQPLNKMLPPSLQQGFNYHSTKVDELDTVRHALHGVRELLLARLS